jgi:hypothetical protein
MTGLIKPPIVALTYRSQRCKGYRAFHWTQVLRVRTRTIAMDFKSDKSS